MNKSIKEQLEEMWCYDFEGPQDWKDNFVKNSKLESELVDVNPLDKKFEYPEKLKEYWKKQDSEVTKIDKIEAELGRKVIEILKENYCQ